MRFRPELCDRNAAEDEVIKFVPAASGGSALLDMVADTGLAKDRGRIAVIAIVKLRTAHHSTPPPVSNKILKEIAS
jgi:hypothetical protein